MPLTVRRHVPALLLVLYLSTTLTYDYYLRIEDRQLGARAKLHSEIVSREAPFQYRYRVLLPYAAEVVARGLQRSEERRVGKECRL